MKRTVFLACAAMAATLMAAGVVSAQTEDGPEGARTIGEVPLEGGQTHVGFVPGEVVVETQDGEYETREVAARTLGAVSEAAKEIEARNPAVEEAGPNYRYRTQFVPDDEWFDFQPANPELPQGQYWLRAIRAPGAWNDSRGGNVKIGVVDSGWQLDHPDLVSKVAGQRDFVADPSDDEAEGYDYHGTSVAGVAAAQTNNGEGVASVGFNARFVMAKACTETCRTVDIAEATEWLAQEQGVKIINLWVGALNDEGARWDRSNYGPCVDLVAPGENVLTTFDKNDPILQAREYAYVNGTSFAAPQVAGVAALIEAKNEAINAEAITRRVQNRATDLGVPGRDEEYGHGLLDARCSVSPGKYDDC